MLWSMILLSMQDVGADEKAFLNLNGLLYKMDYCLFIEVIFIFIHDNVFGSQCGQWPSGPFNFGHL